MGLSRDFPSAFVGSSDCWNLSLKTLQSELFCFVHRGAHKLTSRYRNLTLDRTNQSKTDRVR
ncbi:hypothetical protein GGP91_000478 [Salinibacter ruber]|nr:hypothetical protein [Salinibacter ruber]MCS4054712.1 hypothetical protein [Salinibacter ruber]MCS4057968.1 hypothetical protein [Salinibacter ruber]MCS4101929.1 hypothetical protein [Salinibacter ruber]MCS4162794.1 hypothetical protein [Salinibacter ruber]